MNLLTFDIEDWYHINYPFTDFENFDRREDHGSLVERLRGILALCRAYRSRGTFFVLGRLLEKRPLIGELILEAGQELALHGYEHHLLRDLGPEGFRRDLEVALRVFRDLTGNQPLGFRAPSWSIGPGYPLGPGNHRILWPGLRRFHFPNQEFSVRDSQRPAAPFLSPGSRAVPQTPGNPGVGLCLGTAGCPIRGGFTLISGPGRLFGFLPAGYFTRAVIICFISIPGIFGPGRRH